MVKSSPGIISWALAVRTAMVNDPGRQSLEEEIQLEGFSFLADYLEDILAGPKDGPIIELMKTPGRNKSRPQTRATTAMAVERGKTLEILMSENSSGNKENQSPFSNSAAVNKFHEALLKARNEDSDERGAFAPSSLKDKSKALVLASDNVFSGQNTPMHDISSIRATSKQPLSTINLDQTIDQMNNTEKEDSTITKSMESDMLSEPIRSTTSNELSIIIEDEETEQSRRSIDQSLPPTAKTSSFTKNRSSESTFKILHLSATQGSQNDAASFNELMDSVDDKVGSVGSSQSYISIPLDSSSSIGSKLADFSTTDSANTIPPPFPIIGAPSPLRKSIRTPLDSSSGKVANNKGLSTTRSSWLIKAREAKALEETTKRYHNVSTDNDTLIGFKRKSEEVFGPDEEDIYLGSGGRKAKVSRAHVDVDSFVQSSHPEGVSHSGDEPKPDQVDALMTDEHIIDLEENPEGMIDRLKRTVEGLSSKVGKSMNRSLGGAAATALAEAKAAAEAKVAEKNGIEPKLPSQTQSYSPQEPVVSEEGIAGAFTKPQTNVVADKRLSVSDLISTFEEKGSSQGQAKKAPQTILQHPPGKENDANLSSSMTPPVSPPKLRSQVFSAPKDTVSSSKQPVFRAPEPKQAPTNSTLKPLSTNNSLLSQSSITSTQISSQPDSLFEHDTWQKQTQETDYNDIGFSQTDEKSLHADTDHDMDMDPDDSWRADDRIVINQLWDTANYAEDDTTWSTNPTKSQRAYTTSSHGEQTRDVRNAEEVNDLIQADTQSYIEQNSQQPSQASSSSSQLGFLGTASKLMSSVLGGVKKVKTEPVKSIQLAAAAAKKQQEEKDKKSARLKEMEIRRQQVLQKKVESEKAQEDRKAKEETERRKRDKEEHTDKRPMKLTAKKNEEDVTKKRKVVGDGQKKVESKKPPSSKEKELGMSRIGKPTTAAKANDHSTSVPSSTVRLVGEVESKAPLSAKSKGKTIADEETLQVKIFQKKIQVANQSQAQISIPVATEHIELPDINSEYSDSEDEGRARTFDPPHWAQSPEIREALQAQSKVNPDDVFGAIKPLRMEEMFKARNSRFRARTSSANWLGSDKLTIAEQLEYNQRMGFQS